MNDFIIFILKIAIIIISLLTATGYVYTQKHQKYYELYNTIVFGGLIVSMMLFFYKIWDANKWQDILIYFLPFAISVAILFDYAERKK